MAKTNKPVNVELNIKLKDLTEYFNKAGEENTIVIVNNEIAIDRKYLGYVIEHFVTKGKKPEDIVTLIYPITYDGEVLGTC